MGARLTTRPGRRRETEIQSFPKDQVSMFFFSTTSRCSVYVGKWFVNIEYKIVRSLN